MIKIYIIIKQRIFFFYLFRKQQIIKMIKNYAEQKAIKNLLNYEYFSYEKHTCINFWPDIEIFPLFPLFQLYHDYDINNQNSFLVSKFMGIWFCNFKTCQMNSSHKNNFTVSISSCIRSNTNIYLEGMSCIFQKNTTSTMDKFKSTNLNRVYRGQSRWENTQGWGAQGNHARGILLNTNVSYMTPSNIIALSHEFPWGVSIYSWPKVQVHSN